MAQRPPLTPIIEALPLSTPFVGPEAQERRRRLDGFLAVRVRLDAVPGPALECDPQSTGRSPDLVEEGEHVAASSRHARVAPRRGTAERAADDSHTSIEAGSEPCRVVRGPVVGHDDLVGRT